MSVPRVSVIVPVYNTEKFLPQCLDSLVHQTMHDIEVIVVNDGSKDGSLAVAQQYADRYQNFRVISQENGGLSAARNAGMQCAVGEYVGFLDSDDWARLDMFESLYDRAAADNADLVIADAKVVWEDTHTVESFFDRALWNELPARYKKAPFRIHDEPRVLLLEPAAWKRLYKRSFLERVGFQFAKGLIFEDVPAHFVLLFTAGAISLLDKPVCFYRMGRPGKITARRDHTLFQIFDVFDLAQRALQASGADDLAWALYLKFQMRFCGWLFVQRISQSDRKAFFARWSSQVRRVPRQAFKRFDREFRGLRDRFSTLCLRKGWRSWFTRLMQSEPTAGMKLYAAARYWPRHHFHELLRKCGERLRRSAARVLPMPSRHSRSAMESISRDLAFLKDNLRLELSAARQSVAEIARNSPARSTSRRTNDAYSVRRFELDGEPFVFADEMGASSLWELVEHVRRNYYMHDSVLLRPGDSVVDIGAHVGVFAICVAKRHPYATVYAVEPARNNYRNLLRNIAFNDVKNVVPIRAAIAEHGPSARVFTRPAYSSCVTLSEDVAADYGDVRSERAPSLSLADLFAARKIDHCRLLKVSSKGREAETLASLSATEPRIDYVCGELSSRHADAGVVKAASARVARRSFWRSNDSAAVIVTEGRIPYAVSVVVPVHNVERYLPRCIESLVAQTLADVQIILVNDGSSDRSSDIMRQYARPDLHVVCIDKPNGGCASARNAGLRAALGEYVGFVDSDDWVDATMFKKLYDGAAKTNADVVQCGFTKYYEAENRCESVDEEWIAALMDRVGLRLDQARELISIQPTIWRRIYRRSLLVENHIEFPEDVRMFDDLPFQVMSLASCTTMAVVNEPLYFYRLQRAGQDVGSVDERLFVHFRLFEILSDFIRQRNRPDLLPHVFNLQINTHCWALRRIGEQWKEAYFNKASESLRNPLWRDCAASSLEGKCLLAGNYSWYQAVRCGKTPLALRASFLSRKARRAERRRAA